MSAASRHTSLVTHHSRSGVALVITLIMIAVITFLAITFLAIARRERGQVTTTTEQNIARFATEAGINRATAELITRLISNTNIHAFGLLVSTNFYNPFGFDPNLAVVDQRTNVNYDYTISGNPLTGGPNGEAVANLNNLLYDPRAPVFITNRFSANSTEFRYYIDLDRNGRFTPTGLQTITNEFGGFYDANGAPIPAANPPLAGTLTGFFTGDPQFIGILERPEFPHSPSNRFIARVAWIILPAGKTLDVNYIHNHAKSALNPPLPRQLDGFSRNQGVAPWEINLAAGLRDLNTNAWNTYQYKLGATPSFGVSFDDARDIVAYRHGWDFANVNYSVQNLFPGVGPIAFRDDGIDGYSAGPVMTNYWGWSAAPDADVSRTDKAWSGSDSTNHYFTSQDWFDRNKVVRRNPAPPPGVWTFIERMSNVLATGVSSYDQYTFYRLIEQFGTDSAPDPDDKLNINYVNVGGLKATNFVSWTNDAVLVPAFGRRGSELFFSNAVDRLVRRYSTDWRNQSFNTYTNMFGTNQPFGAGRIPVFVNKRFVYTPSLNRQLQLAANVWDAVNPRYFPGNPPVPMPTVFRPRFRTEGSDVFITDFVEVDKASDLTGTLRDLSNTNMSSSVQPNDLILGVPLIIGAKKGLPNFNEFASEAVIQITRKVELIKSSPPGGGGSINQTNQMFVIGISNVFGAEFWNSYTANFTRPVEVGVTNFLAYSLTNDYAYKLAPVLSPISGATNLVAGSPWPRWTPNKIRDASFLVPLRTNHIVIPDSAYRHSTTTFDQLTTTFERPSGFAFPRWGLTITNRVVAIIKDTGTGRIVDYVQLNGMNSFQDFSLEIAQTETALGFDGVWGTNAPPGAGGKLSDVPGIIQQIEISKGNVEHGGNWQNNGVNQPSGATRDQAIANFLAFFETSHTYTYQPGDGNTYYGTNDGTVANVPFTPTSKRSIPMIWQANDPLVHYTSGDIEYLEKSGVAIPWTPPTATTNTIVNLGQLNSRFQPWGGNPFATAFGSSPGDDALAFQTAVKDPGVTKSDGWQFPTNKLPTLGWLGRIHRGTPWQTVYLKSTRVSDAVNAKIMKPAAWQKWTGNRNVWRSGADNWDDAYMTQPEHDRGLLELFTTALSDSATRGQLPINQSGLAAWSAVFGGMNVLTNSTPDQLVIDNAGPTGFDAFPIDPAGYYDPASASSNAWPAVKKIVEGMSRERARLVPGTTNLVHPNQTFQTLGDILSVPELTEASPFLNLSAVQKEQGLNDAVMEWLPQQMLSLVRVGEPRFVVYSYGQTLKPASRSIQTSGGANFGLCTNYQITAEAVTRAVIRIESAPENPRAVVESYNVLDPE